MLSIARRAHGAAVTARRRQDGSSMLSIARRAHGGAVAAFVLAGCAQPLPENTGGTDVAPTAFGRGVVTVNQDDTYGSTNVSLVGLDGARLSQSFVSSTSLLSGDVVAPSMPSSGDDVVLLDRTYAIVTWVTVRTGEVRAQLHADGDGLARNLWDYLPVAPNKAYVTRYDPVPGKGPHGDLIVVDPSTASVTSPIEKRIDLAPALGLPDGYRVHPARGVVVGDRAYVTTIVATPDYEYADSILVVLDTTTDEITAVQPLHGLHDCVGIAVSPSGDELAVTCSGDLYADAAATQTAAGLVLLAREDLSERKRFEPAELGEGTLGFSLSYASDHAIVSVLLGNGTDGIDDTAVLLDTASGAVRELHRAAPVQIGAVLCPVRVDGNREAEQDPPACFVADAEKGRLLRFPSDKGDLGDPTSIVVDEVIGLPPRYLGQF